jgi:hypothetical protein
MGYLHRTDSWPSSTSPNNDENDETAIRQLPLHMACNFLKTKNAAHREELNVLIAKLVATYPQACGRRDHQGRLPLHEAIWWNASPDTISTLVMAYPEALEQTDDRGQLPQDLLHRRRGDDPDSITVETVETIDKLLRWVFTCWHQSRNEAILRLKLAFGQMP